MRKRDPYVWHDAFELLDQFERWADDMEERHRIEMAAVSRASYEGAMQVRSAYEAELRKITDIQATATPRPTVLFK